MDDRIQRAGRIAWSLIGLLGLLWAVLFLGWWARVVWAPLVIAGAVVFILEPAVSSLAQRGVPRVVSVMGIYLLTGLAAVLAVLAVIPLATSQYDDLRDEIPALQEEAEDFIDDLAARSEDWPVQVPSWDELEDRLDEFGQSGVAADSVDAARTIGGRVLHVVIILVLAPIAAFYVLVDLPRLRTIARSLVPPSFASDMEVINSRIGNAFGGFFRGQIIVAAFVGVASSVGLMVVGLPFWLVIGLVAGLFNLVPLIGPWLAAVPAVAIALTMEDIGTAVAAALVLLVVQQIDNHIISPLVMKRSVHLHPAAVMAALLVGGSAGGFLGLYVSVPIAAAVKIVGGHLWRRYILGWTLEQTKAAAEHDDTAPASGGFMSQIGAGRGLYDRRSGQDRRAEPRGTPDRRASGGRRSSDPAGPQGTHGPEKREGERRGAPRSDSPGPGGDSGS